LRRKNGVTLPHGHSTGGPARDADFALPTLAGRCPNLLAEAGLYRYRDDPAQRHAEVPVDEHNHALGALRYLISRLDARQMARNRVCAALRGRPRGSFPGARPPV
jgi:hypothetical protein